MSYSFGEDPGLIMFNFRAGDEPTTRFDSLAFGFQTRIADAVLMRIDSGSSKDYIKIELVRIHTLIYFNP